MRHADPSRFVASDCAHRPTKTADKLQNKLFFSFILFRFLFSILVNIELKLMIGSLEIFRQM